ncbi:MAG: DUF924 family protein [Pseudomonadota bacterium]
MSTLDKNWSEQILHFWFDELSEQDWFSFSPKIDALIMSRFQMMSKIIFESSLETLDITRQGQMHERSHIQALAAIIALDQFPRNLYRKQSAAFAYDEKALEILHFILNQKSNLDQMFKSLKLSDEMLKNHKKFLLMPLLHSEKLSDQELELEVFAKEINDETQNMYVRKHYEIIKKFNRFPHRNEVLNRPNTAQEIEYLKNSDRFGQ